MAASRHNLLVIPHMAPVSIPTTWRVDGPMMQGSEYGFKSGGVLMGPWCRGQSKVSRVEGGELMGPWCRGQSKVSRVEGGEL